MYRKFIATIAALSVAITAFGAARLLPMKKVPPAIAGVAIVGKMIYDNNNKERKERETVTRAAPPVYERPGITPRFPSDPIRALC